MVKRVIWAVVVVAVLVGAYWEYAHYTAGTRLRDGDVVVSEAESSPIGSSPAGNEAGPGANAQESSQAATTTDTSRSTLSGASRLRSNALSALQAGSNTEPAASGAPATDSERPNAPNGLAFAGTGRYQVYRQGNLTWRINTDDGSTCILFATHEEWRKPEVYNHGCPNS